MPNPIEIPISVETTKAQKNILKLKNQIEAMNKQMSGIQRPLEGLISSALPFGDIIVNQNKKLSQMANNFIKIQEAGGFTKNLATYMEAFGKKTQLVSAFMKQAFGGGIRGMIAKVGTSISSLIPVVTSLMASLGPILLIIGAIIAIVFVLKRMWVNNIGGIQTSFSKVIGSMKDIWGKFVANFDKLLRTLSPLFKILFNVIFVPLEIALKVISIILKIIFAFLDPIFTALGQVGKALEGVFGKQGKDSLKGFWVVLGKLGDVFAFVGKILGTIIATGLKPFIWAIKLIGVIVKIYSAIWEKIGKAIYNAFNTGPLKPFVDVLKTVYGILKGIFDFVMGIINGIGKIFGGVGKSVGKALGLNEEPQSKEITGTTGSPVMASQIFRSGNTVNNNQTVTVHSAGAITPQNAYGIADVMASTLGNQAKV